MPHAPFPSHYPQQNPARLRYSQQLSKYIIPTACVSCPRNMSPLSLEQASVLGVVEVAALTAKASGLK